MLQAIEHRGPRPAVLLIDEVDRCRRRVRGVPVRAARRGGGDDPRARDAAGRAPPIVVLTSNRTRDLHDALKRRCLYHWIDYPSLERTVEIIRRRVPAASTTIAEQAAAAVARLRTLDVQKPPGIAEAINWVAVHRAARRLDRLDEDAAAQTLGSVLKYREDLDLARRAGMAWVVGRVIAGFDMLDRVDLAAVTAAFGRTAARRRAARHARAQPALLAGSGLMPRRPPWTSSTGSARVTLVADHAHIAVFDAVFAQVFEGIADVADTAATPTSRRRRTRRAGGDRGHEARTAARTSGRSLCRACLAPAIGAARSTRPSEPMLVAAASPEERLRRQGLRGLDARGAGRCCGAHRRPSALDPPLRPSRRHVRRHPGERLDLRATLRRSHRTGGDPVEQVLRRRKQRPAPAGADRRRVRVDGAVRPRLPAPAARRGAGDAGGGVRVRDAPDAASRGTSPSRIPTWRCSARPRRRRTGRGGRGSARRWLPSTTSTAAAAWLAVRSS